MLNETFVPIYNVFKIGRAFFMQGAKPSSGMMLNRYDQIVANDAYITDQLISFSYFNNLL